MCLLWGQEGSWPDLLEDECVISLECWGGATFDVAMRFLYEDPWERLVGLLFINAHSNCESSDVVLNIAYLA